MSEKDGFPILPPNLLLAEIYIDCWKCTHLLQLFLEIIDFFKILVKSEEKGRIGSAIRSEKQTLTWTWASVPRHIFGPASDPKSSENKKTIPGLCRPEGELGHSLCRDKPAHSCSHQFLPQAGASSWLPLYKPWRLQEMSPVSHRRRGCRQGDRGGLSKRALTGLSLFDPVWISCPLVVALCPYTSPGQRKRPNPLTSTRLMKAQSPLLSTSMFTRTHPGLSSAPPTFSVLLMSQVIPFSTRSSSGRYRTW